METYLRTIIIFTIITSLIQQMLVGEGFKKLIGMISGVLLILLFLQPVFTFMSEKQNIQNKLTDVANWQTNAKSQREYEQCLQTRYEEMVKLVMSSMGVEKCRVNVKLVTGKDEIANIVICLNGCDGSKKGKIKKQLSQMLDVEEQQIQLEEG